MLRHSTKRNDDVRIDQPNFLQQHRQVEVHLLGRRGSVVDRSSAYDVAAAITAVRREHDAANMTIRAGLGACLETSRVVGREMVHAATAGEEVLHQVVDWSLPGVLICSPRYGGKQIDSILACGRTLVSSYICSGEAYVKTAPS